jgi:hypothetical protein
MKGAVMVKGKGKGRGRKEKKSEGRKGNVKGR